MSLKSLKWHLIHFVGELKDMRQTKDTGFPKWDFWIKSIHFVGELKNMRQTKESGFPNWDFWIKSHPLIRLG